MTRGEIARASAVPNSSEDSAAAPVRPPSSGGQPLPDSLRRSFEPRLGRDFGDVRVHADANAAASASAFGARAYAFGSHLVFGAGQYEPGSPAGRRLLAHELAHVMQQSGRSPMVQREVPRLSQEELERVLAESQRPIREWLDDNLARVRNLSEADAAAELMRQVPEAAQRGSTEVSRIVRDWARERGVTLPTLSLRPPRPTPAPTPSAGAGGRLVSAIEGAITAVTEGVTLEHRGAFLQVRAVGATAGLRAPSGETSLDVAPSGVTLGVTPTGPGLRLRFGLDWSGAIRVAGSVERFHFDMRMSDERWSISLSFPAAHLPVDFSRLGRIFSRGESALRRALSETAGVEDITELPGRLERHVPRIREAVEAAQRATATEPRVTVGLRIGGPGPSAPAPEAERGVEAQILFTLRF